MNEPEELTPQQKEAAKQIADALGGQVADYQANAEPVEAEEEKASRAEREAERERKLAEGRNLYPNYYRLHDEILYKYQQPGKWLHVYFDRHREDTGYDRVEIDIVPRYKQSHMSGDEWRFSYRARVWWKGFLIGSHSMSTMEHITRTLDHWLNYMNEIIHFNYKKYDDGSGHEGMIHFPDHRLQAEYCAQPGCPNKATHTFVKKKTWTRDGCSETTKPNAVHVIRFCPLHTTRGDCALEDADNNLELIEALAERDETERYARAVNTAVAYITLEGDQFGIGQLPLGGVGICDTPVTHE